MVHASREADSRIRHWAATALVLMCSSLAASWPGTAVAGDRVGTKNACAREEKADATPVHADSDVASWTATALAGAYTISQDRPPSNADHVFTAQGWRSWQNVLERSGFLADVQTNNLTSAASASGAPEVLSSSGCEGHKTWNVQVPLSVIFRSDNINMDDQIDAKVSVVQGEGDALGIDRVDLR